MPRPFGWIYCVTNAITGRRYVGQTIQPVRMRWRQHVRDAKAGSDFPLHRAIRKHGAEAFTVDTVATAGSADELHRLEVRHTRELGASVEEGGYCVRIGGKYGNLSELHRAKIAARLQGNTNSRTPIITLDEFRARLLARHEGRVTVIACSWQGMSKPARFRQKGYGTWEADPRNVLLGQGHPVYAREHAQDSRRTDSIRRIRQRLKVRGDCELVESSYRGMLHPATFIDKEFGEFTAQPGNVFHKGTGHIKRAVLRRSDKRAQRSKK